MKIYQTLALGALAFEGNIRDTATKLNAKEMNATEMIATEMIVTEMEATKRNATEKSERFVTNIEIKIGSSYWAFSVTKVGASPRWSFCPNYAWDSLDTITIRKTHPTLLDFSRF